jgi:hypothetical protein
MRRVVKPLLMYLNRKHAFPSLHDILDHSFLINEKDYLYTVPAYNPMELIVHRLILPFYAIHTRERDIAILFPFNE